MATVHISDKCSEKEDAREARMAEEDQKLSRVIEIHGPWRQTSVAAYFQCLNYCTKWSVKLLSLLFLLLCNACFVRSFSLSISLGGFSWGGIYWLRFS